MAAVELALTLPWADILAKAVLHRQRNHAERDTRKHARPVCKTNGNIILME